LNWSFEPDQFGKPADPASTGSFKIALGQFWFVGSVFVW